MAMKKTVRERAIAAWFKISGIAKDDPHLYLYISKSRKNKTIRIRDNYQPVFCATWSYANGGKLERVA